MPAPISRDGDLDKTTDTGLLALAWAWERVANRHHRRADRGDAESYREAIENARLCYEVALRRGVSGSFDHLIEFLRRSGFGDEVVQLCLDAAQRGEPERLVDVASLLPRDEALSHLRRAREAGVAVNELLADRLLTGVTPAQFEIDVAETWQVLSDEMRRRETALRALVSTSPQDQQAHETLDESAIAYLSMLKKFERLLSDVAREDLAEVVQRRHLDVLTGEPLSNWHSFKSSDGTRRSSIERTATVEAWASRLDNRYGHQKALRLLEQQIEAGQPALWHGIAKIYIKLAAVDPTFAEMAIDADEAAVRAGVPDAEQMLYLRIDRCHAMGVLGDQTDRFERILAHAQVLADRGNPHALVDAARCFDVAAQTSMADRVWTRAVQSRTPDSGARLARELLRDISAGVDLDMGSEEVLAATEAVIVRCRTTHPEIEPQLYLAAAHELVRSGKQAAVADLLTKASGILMRRMQKGDVLSVDGYEKVLTAMAYLHAEGCAAAFRSATDRLCDMSEGLASRFPEMTEPLQNVCTRVGNLIRTKRVETGYELSGNETSPTIRLAKMLELEEKPTRLARASYEGNRTSPVAVEVHLRTLSNKERYGSVLEVLRELEADGVELTGEMVHTCARAATRFGDHHVADRLHADWVSGLEATTSDGSPKLAPAIRRWGEELAMRKLATPYTRMSRVELRSSIREDREEVGSEKHDSNAAPTGNKSRRRTEVLSFAPRFDDHETVPDSALVPYLLAGAGDDRDSNGDRHGKDRTATGSEPLGVRETNVTHRDDGHAQQVGGVEI